MLGKKFAGAIELIPMGIPRIPNVQDNIPIPPVA